MLENIYLYKPIISARYLKCIEAGKEKGVKLPEQEDKIYFTNFIKKTPLWSFFVTFFKDNCIYF